MSATRSHSKQPSPSDTQYEIARVRGDALVRCSPRCKQRVVQAPPAISRSSGADTPIARFISPRTMASIPATQASVNRVALDRAMSQPLSTFAEVRERRQQTDSPTVDCASSAVFSCCRFAKDYIRPHPVLSSRNLNSHPHRQHRRRQKTACSGNTRATTCLTRTTATRVELGRPCSQP